MALNNKACGPRLRGLRYHIRENQWVYNRIRDLRFLDFEETIGFYIEFQERYGIDNELRACDPETEYERRKRLKAQALLACNDRYYLLTGLLLRQDMLHPWLFSRCREVEAEPDGYIDLWARGHGKTSIITVAGTIQQVVCDPEITIAIFSATKPLAQEILGQIKNEFETNEHLKEVFSDVLYGNPRMKGEDGRPAKWSLQRGITVKRKGKPKEATIEAHGLIDGQPTGRHFDRHHYDDIVTQDYLQESQLKKTAERFEMADNLGTRHGVAKQIVGTRYHFADVYGQTMERKSAKPRIHPATEDGTLNGQLVLLDPKNWERIKRDQGSKTVAAQMLLNPVAGSEATFRASWLTTYELLPKMMNVYVLVDPSKGKGPRSDRTAIAVIGIDQGGNKYLIDGYCHRMKLSERWHCIKTMKAKWEAHPGVKMVRIGYEQYGMVDDISVMKEMMWTERNYFEIVELRTPETGGHSKRDRIERLEPDIRSGRFLLPCVVHHPDRGGPNYWSVWTEEKRKLNEAKGKTRDYHIGQLIFRRVTELTSAQKNVTAQKYRIVQALRRRDENGDIYDVTRIFIDEVIRHPFAAHDDLLDAVARIYDIDPQIPVHYEVQSTEPLELDSEDTIWMEPS